VGVGARRSQDRCGAKRGRKRWEREEEDEGNGVEPVRLTLFIGGPPNLSVVAPSSVQHSPTALSREVREKIEADFSLTDQALRPKSEFRSSAKREDSRERGCAASSLHREGFPALMPQYSGQALDARVTGRAPMD
jgi:hypothetical protein